jgi:hypothetical protein
MHGAVQYFGNLIEPLQGITGAVLLIFDLGDIPSGTIQRVGERRLRELAGVAPGFHLGNRISVYFGNRFQSLLVRLRRS